MYTHTLTPSLSCAGAFGNYLADRKNNLVRFLLRKFGPHSSVTRYDDFYAYLQQTIATGNICQLRSKFNQVFFEVFLAFYISNPAAGRTESLLNTEAFRNCCYNYFMEWKGEQVATWYKGFTRSFNQTLYYMRALRTADAVLESLVTQRLTNSCSTAIMKMSHCAQCAGYESTHCEGLCLNSLRGCLVDLADLAGPFMEFSNALVRMKNSLDVYGVMDTLDSNLYSMGSTTFAQARDVAQGVSVSLCGGVCAVCSRVYYNVYILYIRKFSLLKYFRKGH